MRFTRTFLLAASLASPVAGQAPLTPRDSAFHVLNRLAYGPTPGEIDSVARSGVMRWVEVQLADAARPESPRPGEAAFDVVATPAARLAELYVQARRDRAAQSTGGTDTSARRAPSPEMREIREVDGATSAFAVWRATTAPEQLREVMSDFWLNHFNVFSRKGADRFLLPSYIDSVIRPHVLGRFEDLLMATARSPAMLVFLDNASSVAPGASPPGARSAFTARRPTGINENYARELMELHTLGVDGGYTQADVVNVARILTGWSVEPPARGAGFRFNAWAHDRGAKEVLGVTFPAGHGEDEGVRLLHLLASAPATMRHVSSQLCARFVSDLHSAGCEDAAVAAWKRSDGDISQVLHAIFTSPDFWAPSVVRSKVKTPLEFVISSLRALGAVPDSTPRVARLVARLGEPLFAQISPAGYPERQDEWVNSSALLGRMNAAVALAADRVPGAAVQLDAVAAAGTDTSRLLQTLDEGVLGGTMTAHTRDVIAAELSTIHDPLAARAFAVGLTLGSPEFQRQ